MTIEQRLEKLERTVRRYQLAFGILGLALLATTAIACSQQALAAQKNAAIPKVIRARKFELVDKKGTPYGALQLVEIKTPFPARFGVIHVRNSTASGVFMSGINPHGNFRGLQPYPTSKDDF